MSKKEKTKRSEEKYPALKPELNLKTRYDLIDYDYIDQLSDKEKDWLNRFTEEYTHAKYDHEGPRIQKKKKDRLDSYNRNNSRNRDILTKSKASGKLTGLESLRHFSTQMSPEEAVLMEERLREVLSNEKLIKKVRDKKLVEDLRERLKELELMKKEFQSSNDDSSGSSS